VIDNDNVQQVVALDRERIARDLHDNAIQRLYAAGLQLHAALGRADLASQVGQTIDTLDEVIREIRATIFGIRSPRTQLEGPAHALEAAVAEAGRVLSTPPQLVIDGPVDDLPAEVAIELASSCRELLSNVVRHSRAAQCWVRLQVTDRDLTLTVEDDGIGCPTATIGGLGVANVRDRATSRGGRCTWSTRRPVGTTVTWWIPLRSDDVASEPTVVALPLPGLEFVDAA
jgi:signal transduction histidine kinase